MELKHSIPLIPPEAKSYNDEPDYGTVTDIEGNSYKTIQIEHRPGWPESGNNAN